MTIGPEQRTHASSKDANRAASSAGPAAGRRAFEPRFEEHHGVLVLRLDYSEVDAARLPEAFELAGSLIRSQRPGSLRILTILRSRFDRAAAEAFKAYAAANKRFVRASAVVAPGFWTAVVTTCKLRDRPDLTLFEDEAAALRWLVRS